MRVLELAIVGLVAISSFGLGKAAEPLPYYGSEDFTPFWFDSDAEELKDFHRIPDFSFVNQDGNTVSSETYKDKIYVASFFFATCQGICPTLTTKLSVIQKTFLEDDNVRILSHSAMPYVDTVPVLRNYADTHKIVSGKWDLVTGPKSDIYGIAKTAYFASEDQGEDQDEGDFLHTEKFLLIDKDRHIRGVYSGLSDTAMVDLISDIRALRASAESTN